MLGCIIEILKIGTSWQRIFAEDACCARVTDTRKILPSANNTLIYYRKPKKIQKSIKNNLNGKVFTRQTFFGTRFIYAMRVGTVMSPCKTIIASKPNH